MTYNGDERLETLTDHAGRVTTYGYDASGEHLISVAGPARSGDGIGDPCDNCDGTFNSGQDDTDGDTVPDCVDLCPGEDDTLDTDTDGIGNNGISFAVPINLARCERPFAIFRGRHADETAEKPVECRLAVEAGLEQHIQHCHVAERDHRPSRCREVRDRK